MKILITGGTGFIGSALRRYLSSTPNDLVLLTRGAPGMELTGSLTVKYVRWNPLERGTWEKEVEGCDAVINLIGKNVFEQRWNPQVKQQVLDSRVVPTRLLVEAIGRAERKPSVLISASAVGYYGHRDDGIITESAQPGNDFLADLAVQWEGEAFKAEQFGVRVAVPRIGLVLERSGGMIGKMLLPFRLFAGGPIGSGRQYLPWIHMEDVVRGILFPLEQEGLKGVYNLTAPEPVTMKEFAKQFGSVLHRPSWLPVPDIALDVLYGEGAKVIVSGQRAVPERLLAAGYRFSYPALRPALEHLLQ
ncbi:MAG: TIGR01777 family protein [Bacteroidetes bacterium]|nr:TIGR01777 family protein [Bacteroidota bacterium]